MPIKNMNNKVMKVRPHVTHQDIGGKEIRLEFQLSNDEVFENAMQGNWACFNFYQRRKKDFSREFPKELYYGKVGDFGYVVADDELGEV